MQLHRGEDTHTDPSVNDTVTMLCSVMAPLKQTYKVIDINMVQ